jgi:geranylgeranyl pyrophosphate synthase
MAAAATDDIVDTLTEWAWELGMVFQLSDDALDLVGNETTLGKPAGSDIREGTFTLPVLAAIAAPDGDRLRALLDRPRPYSEEVVASAIAHLRDGGWVDQAVDAALERLHKAQRLLLDLPETKVRAVLTNLGEYLVERVEAARP